MARTQISTALISNSGPAAIVPSGTVLDYAGPTAPSGWTECDGSAISRTTFSSLFTAIGTTWGIGDGSTTFNVPDLRRRTCVGRGGSATGTLGNTIGSTGGEENHVLSVGELAAHNHGVTDPGHTHTVSDPGHNHSQNSHSHSDSGHGHGISDPGHSHTFPFNQDSGDGTNRTRGCAGGVQSNFGTNGATTGISVSTGTANITGTTATNNSNTTGISNNSNTTGISTSNNGSNTGHNTIQPSAVMIKIIKN
jgi:microcystin-dependent protein